MRRFALLLLLAAPALADTIAFRNVSVIPMTANKVVEKQTVVVRDGKIVSIGKSAPKDATVIDGTGKFLIPGLAEMHGHIPPPKSEMIDEVLLEYVANGITTVRGMLGQPGQLELREQAKKGEIVSPHLYLAGPSFNDQSINSTDEAIEKVMQQKQEGWDLLKVHPGLTRAEYDAMAKTAHEQGMRFGGHVPADVGLLHAIESGQETFDHIDGYVEYLKGDAGPVDEKQLADVVKKTKDAGAWIVPTSALWEVIFDTIPLDTLKAYPELKYVSQKTVDNWSKLYEGRLTSIPRDVAKNVIANRVRILRALHEGGVRILMGTDAPQQFSVPGFSLHRELLRMRDAGMSNYEILRSGTVNVGEYFRKQDSFGTIEPGKRADLVLLDANPLTDITNVAKIAGVLVGTKWYSRADLDARLAKIEEKYSRSA
ncbi:MAG TPA: amidohydrolase family protein, partial [Thermoanaerobaculia bacterium]|nr:amidohydrolase family protein [Thermoanaerobaculia bacterium]